LDFDLMICFVAQQLKEIQQGNVTCEHFNGNGKCCYEDLLQLLPISPVIGITGPERALW
jgi:hypothetical protein